MKIALVGNQNSGKTSLFNVLTGLNQKIGNWPGVTTNIFQGKMKNYDSMIVDLPGIYSLTPYTSEEKVSIDFIFHEPLDLIINVIDTNCLERSLYLTTQLIDLNVNFIIVLNMFDLIKKNIQIDLKQLEKILGVTIIPISIKKNIGVEELKNRIGQKDFLKNKNKKIFPNYIEKFIDYFCQTTKFNRINALNFLEDKFNYVYDEEIIKKKNYIKEKYKTDGEQLIAYFRYQYVEKIKKESIKFFKHNNLTDKLDKIFLNKYFSIPIFLFVMAFIYFISISCVSMFIEKIPLDNFINQFNFSSLWFNSFIKNFVRTIFTVGYFIIQLFVFFVCLSIVETTGYMSRVSLLFDKLFYFFGLSGKSLIPFIIATGCSVPAIMNTCTIKDDSERKTTIVLTPFIPCSAKMTIISFIASDFFAPKIRRLNFLFSFLFYVETILIILVVLLIKKVIFKKKRRNLTYISELPDYKKPNFEYVFYDSFSKIRSFIKKDGILIIFFSIILWLLTSFDWRFHFINNINLSILASIGKIFSPFFYFILGGQFCWAAGIVAIQGVLAKEQIVTTMKFLGPELFNFSTLTAFAFFTFNLFSIPCINTLNALWFEFKSFKKTLLIMLFELLIAWLIASLIGCWRIFL